MANLDESPVGSPLSDLSSDAFEGEEEQDRLAAEVLMPPAKRQKRGDSSLLRATPTINTIDDAGSISSDTDGELPNSPINLRPEDDDTHEQVTACAWEFCNAGDLGNMDRLVEHIQNEHVDTRHKNYTSLGTWCPTSSLK